MDFGFSWLVEEMMNVDGKGIRKIVIKVEIVKEWQQLMIIWVNLELLFRQLCNYRELCNEIFVLNGDFPRGLMKLEESFLTKAIRIPIPCPVEISLTHYPGFTTYMIQFLFFMYFFLN